MSNHDETSVHENVRELDREERRLARLRLAEVRDFPKPEVSSIDDLDPDPKEAA